jgi:cytochrome c oxidase cbb3-type subunit IV
MFKFIRNHADKINNIDIYPLIGLVLFVAFFILVLIWVKSMSKEQIDRVSSLPLDLPTTESTKNL